LPPASPGTTPAEEKPLPECLSILSGSDCRKVGTTGKAGVAQVKTYRIQLSVEDEKKLKQVLKSKKVLTFQAYVMEMLRADWLKTNG
jgi:hypothetical protein